MSDARALLRAQRAARRIEHPHAHYTDSGKLHCAVCREAIKTEGLWENHTRSSTHRQRLLAHQKAKGRPQQPPPPLQATNGGTQKPKNSTDTLSDEALLAQIIGGNSGAGHKRKHGEDSDVDMADAAAAGQPDGQDDEDGADAVRRKRSKYDMGSPPTSAPTTDSSGMFSPASAAARNGSPMKTDSPGVGSPPGLVRRSSGTPSHGIELQIPSRPATPSASQASSTSTPKATPIGRSPLIPQDGHTGQYPAGPSRQGPRANFVTSVTSAGTTEIPHSINSAIATATITKDKSTGPDPPGAAAVAAADDDDWAAFEAEVVHAAPSIARGTAALFPDPTSGGGDAVISAAPLTAEQIAAQAEEGERHAKGRAAVDIELEGEKEDAKRALEAEFEEMEELEARVRKLKAKREAIRKGSIPAANVAAAAAAAAAATTTDTTTTTSAAVSPALNDAVNGTSAAADGDGESRQGDEDSDEDDEDEDDDWGGFRFRG